MTCYYLRLERICVYRKGKQHFENGGKHHEKQHLLQGHAADRHRVRILERSDWDALDAWHEREAGFKYPFTAGQEKAYCAWENCIRNESSTFEVQDLPWDKDIHDFVEALRAAGIAEFAVTDQSTALMRCLHLLADEGCTMQGLCKVSRSEARWGGEGTSEYPGILFRT